ncbi:Uncharacterized conserved protein YdeI, YjbR/CyaY-like superfamily, DUF1801 family [Chitinophaga costaii]|uniref:Uncharacterized conserved protein YdeI, YjbR/CyaY-like superfamily, DUF1801 family n=1 Tax=Chitinophaga costaii TaxID=1335309 RepID=A0A1C4BCQ5_9BACT|nr:DUF1801 domain-containing protein [Chitinophaga costaii]PUZ27658.1 hypothetical protein DCM91_05430 [Chitinophaga costaii]SCC04721.1 Uncharacterized conserved protein YdeI, YjbR/CyaY-like superfamily, DUF1801 family [Chitinophaga costaii]
MHNKNHKVDFYFTEATTWQKELEKLRSIALDAPLTETLKWGVPCYTFQGHNIVLIHSFKAYCALLFFKGALLQDDHGLLVQQSQHTQATRQIRFTNTEEITAQQTLIKAYIHAAIAGEKAGIKVNFTAKTSLIYPEEFQQKIKEIPTLKAAFSALTPGRQRAYNLYFSAPKQSTTRVSRIQKYISHILNGKGLHDE